MNKKSLYKILAIFAVIVLLFYGIYKAINSSTPGQNSQNNQSAQEPTINVPAANNGEVKVKDFTLHPVEKVGDTTALQETGDFDIVYFSNDQSFLITLKSFPAQNARDLAEKAFLTDLQVSKGEACRLKVSLTVPVDVDKNLAGKDYGLSFCPAGIPF